MTQQEELAVLRVKNLVKIYRHRHVVDGISMFVRRGEIVGLLGPNGAGKTTTFSMIAGDEKPNSGLIYFDGMNIAPVPMYMRARMGMGYLPQEPSVFRRLTVEENVLAVLEIMRVSTSERAELVRQMLAEFGLSHVAKQKAYTLSGGERRKLEICRALARKPLLMMLDEPFSGLDPKAVQDIQRIIKTLKERQLGILITDHSVRETLSVVDRAYLIYAGKVLCEGASDFLLNDPASRELYLGWEFKM